MAQDIIMMSGKANVDLESLNFSFRSCVLSERSRNLHSFSKIKERAEVIGLDKSRF